MKASKNNNLKMMLYLISVSRTNGLSKDVIDLLACMMYFLCDVVLLVVGRK
jgi:hypothetical protein